MPARSIASSKLTIKGLSDLVQLACSAVAQSILSLPEDKKQTEIQRLVYLLTVRKGSRTLVLVLHSGLTYSIDYAGTFTV